MTPNAPGLKVRRARASDVPNLARVSYDAFPMDPPIARREEMIRASPVGFENRIVALLDGVHAGQATLIPFHMWLSGARLQTGGIGGVAVAPEARRSGVARALLEESLRLMRARGDVLALLYPFKHAFYRGHGYGHIGERHIFDVAPTVLPGYDGPERVRALKAAEYGLVKDCYARLQVHSNSWIERSDFMWETGWKEPETRVYAVTRPGEKRRICGYFIAQYRQRDGGAALDVMDYGMESEGAMRAMLSMLRGQRDQAAQVRIFAAPDEYLGQRLLEPERPIRESISPPMYSVAGKLGHGYMGRVLKLEPALRQRNYHPTEPLEVSFTVRDPSLAGGAACARLSLGPEGGRVLAAAPARAGARSPRGTSRASLELPVDLFSQCFFGYLPWGVAARDERMKVQGTGALSVLDRAFQVPLPSLRHFF